MCEGGHYWVIEFSSRCKSTCVGECWQCHMNMPVYSSHPTTRFICSASCSICMCKLPPLRLIQIPKSLFHSLFPFTSESPPSTYPPLPFLMMWHIPFLCVSYFTLFSSFFLMQHFCLHRFHAKFQWNSTIMRQLFHSTFLNSIWASWQARNVNTWQKERDRLGFRARQRDRRRK